MAEPTWDDVQPRGPAKAGDNLLAAINEFGEMYEANEEEIARLEAELKAVKERQRVLLEDTIPSFMDEAQMDEVKTRTGAKITVGDKITSNVLKDDRPKAVSWLEKNGHEALIKREVTFSFGRGDEEKQQATELLKVAGRPGKIDTNVHAQTLSAWVREQVKEGKEIPYDLFGVRVARVATIKLAKAD